MPTFLFLKNLKEIDRLSGADPNALEAKIRQHDSDSSSDPSAKDLPTGMVCLNSSIDKTQFECLNEDSSCPGVNCITTESGAVTKSDCDEQVLHFHLRNQSISLRFSLYLCT